MKELSYNRTIYKTATIFTICAVIITLLSLNAMQPAKTYIEPEFLEASHELVEMPELVEPPPIFPFSDDNFEEFGELKNDYSTVRINNKTIVGKSNDIYGDNNIIQGKYNNVYGDNNIIVGDYNKIHGANNTIEGKGNTFSRNSGNIAISGKYNKEFAK